MTKRWLLATCLAISLTGCAWREQAKEVAHETLVEAGATLKEAGSSLATELKSSVQDMVPAVLQSVRTELQASGGDLKAALMAAVPAIGEAAKAGGEKAVTAAVAKKMELDPVERDRIAEFLERANENGLWAALKWLGGGTTIGVILYLWRLFSRYKATVQTVTTVVDSKLEPAVAATFKAAMVAAGGKRAAVDDTINANR